jgi:hypothetical protein
VSRPSLRNAASPCLPLGIKDSLKEDVRLLLLTFDFWAFGFWAFWAFGFWAFWVLAFGFLMKEGFLDVGGFLGERKLLEGRIAGGRLLKRENGLLKGKGLLKGNC